MLLCVSNDVIIFEFDTFSRLIIIMTKTMTKIIMGKKSVFRFVLATGSSFFVNIANKHIL